MCPIDLFQRDDQSHFVLESQRAEAPEEVGGIAHALRKPIRAPDQDRAGLSRIPLNFLHLFREGAATELPSLFVEHEPKTTLAATEELVSLAKRVGSLDVGGLHGGKAPQPRQVFRKSRAGMCEARLTNCDDKPAQETELLPRADGRKVRRVV